MDQEKTPPDGGLNWEKQEELRWLHSEVKALRDMEERFRITFQTCPDGILITRFRDGVLIDVNEQFLEITGFERMDVVGRNTDELKLWLDKSERDKFIATLKSDGSVKRQPMMFRTNQGDVRHGEISARVSVLSNEPHVLIFLRDIHASVLSAVALKEETRERQKVETFLDRIVNNIPDPLFVKDRQHKWIILNHSFCEFMGYSREELLGKSDYDFFPEEEASVFWEKDDEVFRSGGENVNEELITDSSGMQHVIITKKTVFDDGAGNLILCGIIRDVTELAQFQEEQLKASKLESVGLLAGGIAHDFNNILMGVLGFISMSMRLIGSTHPSHRLLSKAESATLKAKDLTHQLLTFSKGGDPVTVVASLDSLVRESAELAIRGSHILCEFDIAPDLWNVEVDKGQIIQVMNNLVLNAVQAAPVSQHIQIRLRNIQGRPEYAVSLENGQYVEVTVTDDGKGIPRECLSRVFDPYFTTKSTGSGLGLTTSYSIVKKHGGYMTLQSEVGKGTRVYLLLPASNKPLSPEIAQDTAVVKGSGHVILMDDQELVRDAAGMMLRELGYTVDVVPDGETLMQEFKRALSAGKPYDVVIVDLTIPGGMGGEEAIRLIKTIHPEVRAIVSSGYSNDPILSNYKLYGFSGCISKPYNIGQLSRVLGVVMEES